MVDSYESMVDDIRVPPAASDAAAPYYDMWGWQEFWHRTETPFFDDCFESHSFVHRRRFLDAGCGTGHYLDRYETLFTDAYGLDASSGMLDLAAARCPEASLAIGSIISMPYADAMFDLVTCARVMSHVHDLNTALSELVRVIAPGGALLLSSVDESHPYSLTRLPAGDRHVFADTVKHGREVVAAMLLAAGMRISATALICSDGSIMTCSGRFAAARPGVTAWALMAEKPPLAVS
jgi:Methylase involved in ubiquinone/menaquinone biosynthesis